MVEILDATPRISARSTDSIDAERIEAILRRAARPSLADVESAVQCALDLRGLDLEQAAILLQADGVGGELLFAAANRVKSAIYGGRVVLFAPLYLSNVCSNNCLYCSFRRDNREIQRRVLTLEEVADQVRALENMGHKRILVESGEHPSGNHLDFVLQAIETIYATSVGRGSIRRVNVNVAATTVESYRRLKAAAIGTYQLFQETYHRPTYRQMHPSGPKADYDYHLTAMDRAMEAGIDDVGIGALFGLYDFRFEVLALLCHAAHLEQAFGVGPHTISVPRLRPAHGVDFAPPHAVDDGDFKRLVAVLRLAVPYTGIILSTRETAEMRDELLSLGVSQVSAASCTSPGGYSQADSDDGQFSTADHRSLDEMVRDICKLGYMPSFCTACYRRGRTGATFMDLAKPGDIQEMCRPNALLTFQEYLEDYASSETRAMGEALVEQQTGLIQKKALKNGTRERLERVKHGERDIYF